MKKSKKWIILLVSGIVIILIGWVRYQQVNASDIRAVPEKMFSENQQVNTDQVNFKVIDSQIEHHQGNVSVKIALTIEVKRDSNFGFHEENKGFMDNMWLNIPYAINAPVERINFPNGKKFKYSDIKISKPMNIVLNFQTTKMNYESRNQKMRFSFLIPENKRYVKYSMNLE